MSKDLPQDENTDPCMFPNTSIQMTDINLGLSLPLGLCTNSGDLSIVLDANTGEHLYLELYQGDLNLYYFESENANPQKLWTKPVALKPNMPAHVISLLEANHVMAFVSEHAAYNGYQDPVTPGEYLWWLEDEATVQEQEAIDHEDEAADRIPFAQTLRSTASILRQWGYEPIPQKR